MQCSIGAPFFLRSRKTSPHHVQYGNILNVALYFSFDPVTHMLERYTNSTKKGGILELLLHHYIDYWLVKRGKEGGQVILPPLPSPPLYIYKELLLLILTPVKCWYLITLY